MRLEDRTDMGYDQPLPKNVSFTGVFHNVRNLNANTRLKPLKTKTFVNSRPTEAKTKLLKPMQDDLTTKQELKPTPTQD